MSRNEIDKGELLVKKRINSSKGKFILSVIYEEDKFELRIKINTDTGDEYNAALPMELLRPFRKDLDVR